MVEPKDVKRHAGRFAVPPYAIHIVGDDFEIQTRPGSEWEFIARLSAPSADECRLMLQRLRSTLRWSRPMLAAFLGVSARAVRSWETRQRNPSASARRLVWLANRMVHQPQSVARAADWLVWNRGVDLDDWCERMGEAESLD